MVDMIAKNDLQKMYTNDGLSMMQIAAKLSVSHSTVAYWMKKYGIIRRSLSDAITQLNHPDGDPFTIGKIDSIERAKLYGIGIGLYWGEGTKANEYQVRLGNTDPELLRIFIRFLKEIYDVEIHDLRFGLQIFTDISSEEAVQYWTTKLGIKSNQLYKVHVTKSGSLGTYRKKSKYGVLTVYYNNKRLRDIIVGELPR